MPSIKGVEAALSLIKSDESKILELTLGSQIITPGQEVPKADAQSPPLLSFPSASSNKTYMVISLDIDAPFVSLPVLGPILHWIQPGLKVANSSQLESSAPFVANYIGPAPPPGSGSHRYVFLLYEQPDAFDGTKYAPAGGKNLSNWGRMRYDLGAFEKEAGLGAVVSANYFRSK